MLPQLKRSSLTSSVAVLKSLESVDSWDLGDHDGIRT